MRNQKGITLIALVITIIVLLILAGVSIAMLTGQNGILTQASNAKTETTNAEKAEKINMELNAFKADILAYGTIKNETKTNAEANLPTSEGYNINDSANPIVISNGSIAGKIYTEATGEGASAHAKGEIEPATK